MPPADGTGFVPEARLNPRLTEHQWMAAMRLDPRVRPAERTWPALRAAVAGRYHFLKHALRWRFKDRVELPYNHTRPKLVGRPWSPY